MPNNLIIKIFLYIIGILFFFSSITSIAFAGQTKNFPKQFIIDTDMGVDDIIAILYMLRHPDIQVKAITIECDGNADCAPALNNLVNILQLLHRTEIPIAVGSKTPLAGSHHYPEYILKDADNLYGVKLKQVDFIQPKKTARELLTNLLQTTTQPIYILALGPLTAIAEVLQHNPQLKNKFQMIYFMGGAINVAGNINIVDSTIPNKVAEWNIYIDPFAANLVFHSKVPLTLIPLDLTNQVLIDNKFYQQLKSQGKSVPAKFLINLFENNKSMLLHKDWYFWDPMAAVIAVNNNLAVFKTEKLSVKLKPEIQSGRVFVDQKFGVNIRVADKIDSEKFKAVLLGGLY